MALSISELASNPKKCIARLNLKGCTRVLNTLDAAYFGKSANLVSDPVYDVIRSLILDKYPELDSQVGYKTDDDDIKLPAPMASLNQYKLGSAKLTAALANNDSWCVTDKLDGLSIEIVYEGGKPTAAYSRGNATTGKSLTHHLPNMSVPKTIPFKGLFIVRCEGLIPEKTFHDHLHTSAGGKYKAARNAASGMMRGFKANPNVKHIDFVAFGIIGGPKSKQVKSKQLAQLKSYKFKTVVNEVENDLLEDELLELLEVRFAKSKYELDGIVIEDDTVVPKVSSSNPTHGFKFKMNSDADSVYAPVASVVYTETKHGDLYPVVHFEPVIMSDGVTVTKAAGHNGYYIRHGYLKDKKNEGKKARPIGPGAVVKLVRSGKVIPYILEVIRPASKPALPIVPYTDDGLVFHPKKRSVLRDARLAGGFLKTLGIKDIGASAMTDLMHAGYTDPKQILGLSKAQSIKVYGRARGTKVYDQILDVKKGTDFNVWLRAISAYYIKGSDTTYDTILSEYPEILGLADANKVHEIADLIRSISRLKNKADVLAPVIIQAYNVALDSKVKLLEKEQLQVVGSRMAGIVVGFSGVRDAKLSESIILQGGHAADSVKSNTNVLIVKDPGAGTTKIEKALAKGIPVMTIGEFKEKYKL